MRSGFVVVVAVLFLNACAGNRVYHDKGYIYNPSSVWNNFDYDYSVSYERVTIGLRAKLQAVWEVRIASGAYTKSSVSDVKQLVALLAPDDGMPNRVICSGNSKGVVILLHGQYDSPYTMKDIGGFFNDYCYRTRFLLLPGHGAVPGDLRHLDYRQWIRAVDYTVTQTQQDFKGEKIIFAGFSTGGGLALNYASDHPDDVEALLLFAPLVKLPWYRVFGAYMFEAIGEYVQKKSELDSFKYESTSANSIIQANHLANLVHDKLADNNLSVPVFITQAKNDYTLSADYLLELFNEKVFSPDSIFLLYSPVKVEGFEFLGCDDADEDVFSNIKKVACNSSFSYSGSTEATIDDYSHMSLSISPTNQHYGINENYRYCLQYNKGSNLSRCLEGIKPDVCYGERGIFRGRHISRACPEYDTVMIRLTSNPRFEHLKKQIRFFMERNGL